MALHELDMLLFYDATSPTIIAHSAINTLHIIAVSLQQVNVSEIII